jgi:mono/diheme cytochrome c family protein
VALLACLAGCYASARYPADLPYPLRKDLLVTETSPKAEPRRLPPPGEIEAGILKASEDGNAKALDPTKLGGGDRNELREALEHVFGTPAKPTVGVEGEAIDALKLDDPELRRGSMHYRRHCLHCHGLAGDGRGPTGPWVNPHPRDYRQGQFKFISTSFDVAGFKPRRADLLRTLRVGIDGTSMPSFGLLPDRDLEELASYVIHLSIRGETEFQTMRALLEGEGSKEALEGGSIESHVTTWAQRILEQWLEADKSINAPPSYPEEFKEKAALKASVARGYQMFISQEKAACIACHTDYGRQVPYRFDVWGTLVRPANLMVSTYRGGRRPIDFYWRVTKGIGPSGMTGQGVPGKSSKLSEKDMWDLVNFVQALPYPAMLPDDIREKVYGALSKPRKTEAHASR